MQVLQVGKYYHPAKGGIETHLRTLASELLAHAAIEVTVAGQRWQKTDVIDGIAIERLAVAATVMGAPICLGLIERLRKTSADIVHVHLPNPWAVIAYLASGCKRPLVATYHSDIVRQSSIEPAFRPILLKFLHRSSAIICSSPNLIQHSPILQKFQERCVVIPFGVDLHALDEIRSPAVEAITAVHKEPIVLAVGRLVYYKGFEHLIAAMVQISGSLIIIGKGPLKANLLRLASQLGISEKVSILDHVEDVRPYYRAARLFVLPSIARSEAFGLVQLEAMAAAKPVVNTWLDSGVPFVSQHGITGLTVPPADEHALAAAVNRLLGDPALRASLGAAGKLRVQQEFTVEKMISRTLRLYEGIVSQSHMFTPTQTEKAQAASN